ncbi:hypothetical protein, partial [Acinetobacter baumannii]
MDRVREQEERAAQGQARNKAAALDEAKQLAAKSGNMTSDESRRLVDAVERALGQDAARDMQNG